VSHWPPADLWGFNAHPGPPRQAYHKPLTVSTLPSLQLGLTHPHPVPDGYGSIPPAQSSQRSQPPGGREGCSQGGPSTPPSVLSLLPQTTTFLPASLPSIGPPFFVVLRFELRPYTWSHSTSPFCVYVCVEFFHDRVLQTICPGLALNQDPPDLCLLSS
jgi:hypothetical protein